MIHFHFDYYNHIDNTNIRADDFTNYFTTMINNLRIKLLINCKN